MHLRTTFLFLVVAVVYGAVRVPVKVEAGAPNSPVTVQMDFGALLERAGVRGHLDPNSIVVRCQGGEVATHLSDAIERGEASGTVSWNARTAVERDCQISFDVIEHGRKAFREYREAVGIGDNFYYNRAGEFDPLGAGMNNDLPIAVDWDGDGRTDLLQRILYSTTLDDPWWGALLWRNIGTNARPRFDRYVRLMADGRVIQDKYANYQLMDWNGDGLMDLLCGVGGGPERGVLKVYLNTGRRDAYGLPVLTAGPRIPWHGGGEFNYGMRVLDWSGRGMPELITLHARVEYFPKQIMETIWYRHQRRGQEFGEPERVPLAGTGENSDTWQTDLYDVNGDGKPDAIGFSRGLRSSRCEACVLAWENTGTREAPAFTKAPECILRTGPNEFLSPISADTPAFHGILTGYMGAWLKYYEAAPKAGQFTDRGMLLARGLPCSAGGYSSVEVVDWDGDGDLDFVAGNETGYVKLIENISQNGRAMFRSPRDIPLTDGSLMYAARWQYIQDADPERPVGQAKPAVVDWDGDGDLDVLVGNNSNRISYFENVGTRRQPRYAPARKLTHDGGEHFAFRMHPAAVDWNGDGLVDLVTGYQGPRDRNDGPDIAVSLFRRYRDKNGALRLGKPEVFRMEDGSELRTPIPYCHGFEVVDWDGDGDYDLLVNQKSQLVLYRNVGSNARPRFRRELLKMYGQPISVSHHESSLKAVDWDKDGKLDLVVGGESGYVFFLRRAALEAEAAPKYTLGAPEVIGR